MLKRLQLTTVMLVIAIAAIAQGHVKGRVMDKNTSEALSFVSVTLSPQGSTTIVAGATTDATGTFNLRNIKYGEYTMTLTFVGYKTITKNVTLSAKHQTASFPTLHMAEDATVLNEVQVTGQRSTMKLEVDRKAFDVSSMISNAGQSASEVLENIPSVEVDNDGNVSLRGNSSVEVWINGRASGLTAENRAQILQQLPAESIERIEVIDNPSAKYSAEGSAGIINIVLKKDAKPGYYGSVQAGADTRSGANTSFNINSNSSKFDTYLSIGYRHREDAGINSSTQTNFFSGRPNTHERHDTKSNSLGNMMFTRAGITWHATSKDDFSLSGMLFTGKNKSFSSTPYYYSKDTQAGEELTRIQQRDNSSNGPMMMINAEFNYRHNFTEKNFLDFIVSHHRWKSDVENIYQDSIHNFETAAPTEYSYQSRPLYMFHHSTEVRLDYEAPLSEVLKLQTGYNGEFNKEDTPQESFEAANWEGFGMTEDHKYYNKFVYNNNIHALYATLSYNKGKFGIMAGLRGEYWRVKTESQNWDQAHGIVKPDEPFKKDYFQLFPSVFMSYQLTQTQQLQLNYTRRLRRPWGGQLNSFRNTSDASIISFGNPLLTPEYSNSFALNYLKTWDLHSLLVSAYYRPTTDIMQRINYRNMQPGDDYEKMFNTTENVARSTSTGIEITAKNKFGRRLDITTNVNGYYYKLNAFSYEINGQTVSGEAQENFTWNARIMASLSLPYDISVQTSGNYRSRSVLTQGYRPAMFGMDLGVRKNFLNRKFTLSINCRDLLNTRKFKSHTSSDTFVRDQVNKRHSRKVNFTLTWNFGNSNAKKKRPQQHDGNGDEEEGSSMNGYDM